MASSSAIPKQLKEHLLEQQEPFRLHAYLLERGLTVKCLSSGVGNGCCSINLFKTPDRSPFSRELLLRSTRVLKLVLFKLVYANSGRDDEFQTAETKLEEESQTTRYRHRSSSKRNQPFFLGNMKEQEVRKHIHITIMQFFLSSKRTINARNNRSRNRFICQMLIF